MNIDASRNNILFILLHLHSVKVLCFFLWYYLLMLQKKKKRQNRYESHCQMLWGKCFQNIVSDFFLNSHLSPSFSCCFFLIFVELENRLSTRQDDLLTSNQEALLWKLLSLGWIWCMGSFCDLRHRGRLIRPPHFLSHTNVNSSDKVTSYTDLFI